MTGSPASTSCVSDAALVRRNVMSRRRSGEDVDDIKANQSEARKNESRKRSSRGLQSGVLCVGRSVMSEESGRSGDDALHVTAKNFSE